MPGKIELTVYLARIMAPFLTLVALAAVFMGMLNALGHFFVAGAFPGDVQRRDIVIALTLSRLRRRRVSSRSCWSRSRRWSAAFGQLAIQWRPLRGGLPLSAMLDLQDPALARVLLLMGPGTIGMAATQINVFVNTQFATGEGTGAVSWLDYAFGDVPADRPVRRLDRRGVHAGALAAGREQRHARMRSTTSARRSA